MHYTMFGKVLKVTGQFTLGMAAAISFDEDADKECRNKRQLDNLSDGFGGIIADGEDITLQEAEVVQSCGELYDIHY